MEKGVSSFGDQGEWVRGTQAGPFFLVGYTPSLTNSARYKKSRKIIFRPFVIHDGLTLTGAGSVIV